MGAFILGRSLRALEQVCSGDGVEEYDVLDILQQLVDKSLVMVERDIAGDLRYTMIESVWQYAKEKLKESGEEVAVNNRHLKFFLEYAEELHPKLEGPSKSTGSMRGRPMPGISVPPCAGRLSPNSANPASA